MNKVILIGRLARDPETRYSQGEKQTAITRYTLAVDRRFKREGEQEVDFLNCVCFGKSAEFAEKYFHKGLKVAVTGRIQTGSYTNKEGVKVYTTDIFVEEQEFVESKRDSQQSEHSEQQPDKSPFGSTPTDENGFMNIPDGLDDELPF